MTQAQWDELTSNNPNWDVILIGDGSGLKAAEPCGYACAIYEKYADGAIKQDMVYGGSSHGTNNNAELMAYVSAMNFLMARKAEEGRKQQYATVVIVTDSEYVVKNGGKANLLPRWLLDRMSAFGYRFVKQHAKRCVFEENVVADKLSRKARLAMTQKKKEKN